MEKEEKFLKALKDLSIWNFAFSRFIAELDCVIFIDSGIDTNYF